MGNYFKLLTNLNESNSFISKPAAKLACVLSGQSSFSHSELTPSQTKLLNYFSTLGFTCLPTNFPYNSGHHFPKAALASLPAASLRNAAQFSYSVMSPEYCRLLAKHLQPLFDNSTETVIILNSLGMQMLSSAQKYLALKSGAKRFVIGLGPVSLNHLDQELFNTLIIKGSGDWLTQSLDQHQADYWVNCHHLEYYHNPEVIKIISRHTKND